MKAMILLFSALVATPLASQDLVVMKSGETLACRIDDLTDAFVSVTLPGAAGAVGSAKRTLAIPQVERIEYGFRPGEAALFEKRGSATAAELEPWWDLWFPHLHRSSSRGGAWGVAYARAIMREGRVIGVEKALSLFDHLIARAWSSQDKAAAKHGRIEALIAKGDLATATAEARLLAREAQDPVLLLEVGHLLAEADFLTLRELEEEHPRWFDDDEVRPRRHELYHRALDQFLKPHLFHATHEEAAARGLFCAAELLRFGGEVAEARARWEDLLELYPETSFAAKARESLAAFPSTPDPKAAAP